MIQVSYKMYFLDRVQRLEPKSFKPTVSYWKGSFSPSNRGNNGSKTTIDTTLGV